MSCDLYHPIRSQNLYLDVLSGHLLTEQEDLLASLRGRRDVADVHDLQTLPRLEKS